MSLQTSGNSSKDRVAFLAHSEQAFTLVTQPETLEKLARGDVVDQIVASNAPVDIASVVSDADHHFRGSTAPRVGLLSVEPHGNLFVKVRRVVAANTLALQGFLLLMSFPLGRQMLVTQPRVGMGYTRKYLRKAAAYPAALGGYTIDGPYTRRPRKMAERLDRFFHWLGA